MSAEVPAGASAPRTGGASAGAMPAVVEMGPANNNRRRNNRNRNTRKNKPNPFHLGIPVNSSKPGVMPSVVEPVPNPFHLGIPANYADPIAPVAAAAGNVRRSTNADRIAALERQLAELQRMLAAALPVAAPIGGGGGGGMPAAPPRLGPVDGGSALTLHRATLNEISQPTVTGIAGPKYNEFYKVLAKFPKLSINYWHENNSALGSGLKPRNFGVNSFFSTNHAQYLVYLKYLDLLQKQGVRIVD